MKGIIRFTLCLLFLCTPLVVIAQDSTRTIGHVPITEHRVHIESEHWIEMAVGNGPINCQADTYTITCSVDLDDCGLCCILRYYTETVTFKGSLPTHVVKTGWEMREGERLYFEENSFLVNNRGEWRTVREDLASPPNDDAPANDAPPGPMEEFTPVEQAPRPEPTPAPNVDEPESGFLSDEFVPPNLPPLGTDEPTRDPFLNYPPPLPAPSTVPQTEEIERIDNAVPGLQHQTPEPTPMPERSNSEEDVDLDVKAVA